MQVLSDKITEAIRKDKVLSNLDDADAVRDDAVKKLFKIIDGYAAMPLEKFSTPAAHIKTVLSKFGLTIIYESFASESSYIESMLTDLAAVQAEVGALPGVAEAIAALRAAQTDFTNKRVDYEKTLSVNQFAESATAIKKPLLELINNKLVPYLDTMKMVDAEKYTAFSNAVEQTLGTINSAVGLRTKAKVAGALGKYVN